MRLMGIGSGYRVRPGAGHLWPLQNPLVAGSIAGQLPALEQAVG
jgi:hypothetical protein